jgi:uncharacterized protein involved in type VI secretion and phage assembly
MLKLNQEHRQASIHTPWGEHKFVLQSFGGSEALSQEFTYSTGVLSDDPVIDGNALIGKRISVVYHDEDGRLASPKRK